MLSGPEVSPLLVRRNCSKNGTMAAGFSMGMPAVRSSIPLTSSEASDLACALTGGPFGMGLVFFFFFLTADVWLGVWARRKQGAARSSRTHAAARKSRMELFLRYLRGSFMHRPCLE